jgi:hypothetical protein
MSVDAHRRAEALMAEAERQASRGLSQEARALYRQAAEEEARAFAHIPLERSRTRGIIAVSAVALFRRSGALDEAVRHAHRYLVDQNGLPDFAREQLQELLSDSQREQQALTSGRTRVE